MVKHQFSFGSVVYCGHTLMMVPVSILPLLLSVTLTRLFSVSISHSQTGSALPPPLPPPLPSRTGISFTSAVVIAI